ncbi:hypothetical protein RHOSPDRAFT_26729 [Rhodotorula sp. JG-1b]|nr:hypothetical protein RHOSPDRAFT_26729 [Rhodotorula sp. JG-1b]
MSHASQIPGSTQQRNKTQQSANTGKAFFPGAADRLRSLFLKKLQGIDDPTQQVAIHSQLLVHLWVRPFQQAALQRDGKFLYNTLRSQLRLALGQLQQRIEQTLSQENTALSQLQAAAKLLHLTISDEEHAEAAAVQKFINDIITCTNLEDASIPSSKLDYADCPRPRYKTWIDRLLIVIGASVLGKSGNARWRACINDLAAIGKELPKNLFTWRQQLLEQLPEDEFDKLALADAIAWDYWLKDFQERVQAVSKRWGALEAAYYVLPQKFKMMQKQVRYYKGSEAAVATLFNSQQEQQPSSNSNVQGEKDHRLWLEKHHSSQPGPPKRKRRDRPDVQEPLMSSPPAGNTTPGRQNKRVMPKFARFQKSRGSAYRALLPVSSDIPVEGNMLSWNDLPPVGPAQSAPQLGYYKPPSGFNPAILPASWATPYHPFSNQDRHGTGQMQLNCFDPLLGPAADQPVLNQGYFDPNRFIVFLNHPAAPEDNPIEAAMQQYSSNPSGVGCVLAAHWNRQTCKND